MTTNLNAIAAVNNEIVAFKQYKELENELKAIPKGKVKQINLDTKAAISTVLGVLPKVRAYREQMATLPGANMEEFDAIERYVGALSQADAYHTIATNPPDDLVDVQAEGAELRDVMYVDAQVQVRRGLINEEALKDLNGPVGYKNLAADLQSLSTVYLANWDKLADTTSVKEAEIERAQQISFYLFRSVGKREQSPALIAETSDMRARAFTLLTDAYDNARRAIIFLRWHEGDADLICPSLFAGRSNGRVKPVEDSTDKPVTPGANPAPAANAGTNAAPVANANANSSHMTTPEVAAKGPFV